MERKSYWYSIIQYCPNNIRGEKINIGLLLHNPSESELYHSILDENSPKIKGMLQDQISTRVFRLQKDQLDYYFKKITDERDLLSPALNTDDFLSTLQVKLPSEFIISEPTFSRSRNPDQLFESLITTYIGEMVSKEIIKESETIRDVKLYTKNYFNQREWIGTKIKPNVKIHPIKDLKNMQFNIDFVFKNGIWNLILAVPSNTNNEKLIGWFSKTKTMLDVYQKESEFHILYDNNDQLNEDKTIFDMVNYLQKSDLRVKPAEIESDSFGILCKKVEQEAKDITQYEQELVAM